ncbi:MAG: right-handed parallel beta-helix repeat-containing protein [Kofleriaceae bacterium]|nr:right-handed parallel beta-helix repeat-containing protein [Kofleriaceae bacterium]
MRTMLSVLALTVAACSGDANNGGGGDDVDAAPDADLDPIPSDAIYLDPVVGRADAPGTAEAPWPGLADAIAAGLVATVPDGKTLVLRDGNHGNATFEGEHATAVIIRNAPGARPQLGRLELRRGKGWHLRGLTISPEFATAPYAGNIVSLGEAGTSSDLILEKSVVYGASDTSGWTAAQWMSANSGILMGRNGTGLTVRTTHVYNVRFGIAITSFTSTVEGNLVNEFSADGIRVTRDGGTVTDNVIKNIYVSDADGDANHDDAIQCFLFNVGTGTVRDVTLRGNLILNTENAAQPLRAQMQGIGFFDGPLVNFTVENNVVFVDHWHGVSLYDAQGSHITNNLTYSRWGGPAKPWVMLGEKLDMAAGNVVHGNVAHTFDFDADATVDAADNTTVTETLAEQRLTERLAAIEATWGPLFDNIPRLAP